MPPRKRKPPSEDPHFHPDPDLFFPGRGQVLAGLVLRATTGRGEVLGLSHPPLPAGWTLVLAADIPGPVSFQVFRGRFPVLGSDLIQYRGEPVALVAGPDEDQVRRWAREVRVVLRPAGTEEPLPPSRSRLVTGGDKAAALAGVTGTMDVEGVYESGAQDHGHFDPVEVLAHVTQDEVGVRLKTQWPAHVVSSVSRALDRESGTVKVLGGASSGTANSQVWFPSLLAVYAALLSRAAGRPVLLRLSKEEEFLYSPKRPEARVKLRSTLAPDGRLLSLEADLEVETGAYGILDEELLDRAVVGLLAPYRLGHYVVRARTVVSATPPRGPVGGLGEALGLFALESHVHDICRSLGQDPAQWRQDQAPVKDNRTFYGQILRSDNPLKLLIPQLARATDFSRKYAAFELLQERADRFREEALPLRGIGLASGFQGNGFLAGGTSPVNIEARLEVDGRVSLYVPLVTANSRSEALWKQSVAAALQVPVAGVRLCPVFSGLHPTGGPSISSRAFEIVPKLLVQVSEGIAQRRFRQPLPITVRKVYRRTKGPAWDAETFSGQPFLNFSWGAAVAEVEVIPSWPRCASARSACWSTWAPASTRLRRATP